MAKPAPAPGGALFANWRQNIIYIGFVVIFVIFALFLLAPGVGPVARSPCNAR